MSREAITLEAIEARRLQWDGLTYDDCQWLVDRVRDQDEALRIMHEDRLKMVDEVAALRRAHAWLIETVGDSCVDSYWCACGESINNHTDDCEWVKAKELKL